MFYPANYFSDVMWIGLRGSVIWFNRLAQESIENFAFYVHTWNINTFSK